MMGLGEKRTHETLGARVSKRLACALSRGLAWMDGAGMWCKTSPLGVSVIHDVEFAFAKCVPQLDRPVSRSGNNLTIIGGERDPARMGKPLSTGSATARQNIDPDSMGIAAR